MSFLELKVPPLVVWAVAAVASAAAARFFPGANLPFPGHRSVAIAVLLAGVAVAVAGVVSFRQAKTTVNPLSPEKATSVVTTGIYRLTRNPMYLGMASALVGVAAWDASLVGLLLVGVFCAYITRFQVQPEERALLASFGEEFATYMSRVRRWL
jgi:protein-S-isoprenylcysteine O-methyltransferase Ste14